MVRTHAALLPGLYICELNNHRVSRWKDGQCEIVLGGFGRDAISGVAGPRSICAWQQHLCLAEAGRLSHWSCSQRGLARPEAMWELKASVVCAHEDELYIAENDVVSCWKGGQRRIVAKAEQVMGLAVDSMKRVYVSEYEHDQVTRWDGGVAEIVAGGKGYGDDLEQLAGPMGLAIQETKHEAGRSV